MILRTLPFFAFTLPLLGEFTYVDATLDNTTLAGEELTLEPPANYDTESNSNDDLWSLRIVSGFEGGGTFFESDTGSSAGDSENTADLITSITIPTAGTYQIVAIFNPSSNRDIAARIGSSPTQDDVFDDSNFLRVDRDGAPEIIFDSSYTNGRGSNAGAADLGTVTTTTDNEVIQIHINGLASTEANDSERTRYDGIGFGLVVPDVPEEPVFPPGATTHRDVFIIAGQSNADGRGLNSELVGDFDSFTAQQPEVIIHYSNPAYGDTLDDPADDPLYQNWSFVRPGFSIAPGSNGSLPRGTFGVEIGAGIELAQHFPNPAFIKVTRGGTRLTRETEDWHPPIPVEDEGPLYTELISSVQQALQELTDAGDTYTLHAIFWHQGESDGSNSGINEYPQTIQDFITCVRRDLGHPNLRFVIGELSAERQDENIRGIQWDVSRIIRNANFVPSLNFLTYDGTHFNADSMLRFGVRVGEMLRGQERTLSFEEPAFTLTDFTPIPVDPTPDPAPPRLPAIATLDRQFDFTADNDFEVVASTDSGEYIGGQAVGNLTLAGPLAGEVESILPLSAARSMQAEFLPAESDSTLLVAGWAEDSNDDERFDASETGLGMGLNSDGVFFLRVGTNLFPSSLGYQADDWYQLTTSWTEPDLLGMRQIELRVRNLTNATDLNNGAPLISINTAISPPALWNGIGLLVDRGLLDSIGVEERGFSGWMENRFPDLVGGPEGDDDGDGIANAFEYVLGLDPTQSDSSTDAPFPSLEDDFFTLSYPEIRRAEDVLVEVESSTDLVIWEPVPGEFLEDSINFSADVTEEPRLFFRPSLTIEE